MANYIMTYTGVRFEPTCPDPAGIRIEDIAHALSLICRGNGHVKSFWSVGEHSICCAREAAARGLSDRMVLACLLHDAGECYLSDIPRPFKQSLPAYRDLEDRLLDMIYKKLLGSPLSASEQKMLREIDDAMLWFDLRELLRGSQQGEEPVIHISLDYSVRPFAEVEQEFLSIYRKHSRGV